MKAQVFVLLMTSVAVGACCATPCPVEPPAPTPITRLDIDQVNALIPYMVDRKKHGELQSQVIEAPDKSYVVTLQRQAFTFALWIDADGRPVMPPKGDGSATSIKLAAQHHGSFTVGCQSICSWPAPGANISCLTTGCTPISDVSCGCTPLDCGNCVPLGCGAYVDGFLSGKLVML